MTREKVYEEALKRIAESDACTCEDEAHEECPLTIAREALTWAPVVNGT